MERYDAIVLGAGGIGSAALYALARRGVRTLGIDRFNPPHNRGSSHGQTRVIRQAYFEHPDYVPLLLESYRGWHDLERRSDKKLFNPIGLIQLGPADGIIVPGVLRAAEKHRLPVQALTAAETQRRWPGLRVGNDVVGVYEPAAGYLLVEDCVQAHLDLARAAGAELLTDTEVVRWDSDEREVRVYTADRQFTATRLIVTAGAWSSRLLADLGVSLMVRRKSLFWFATDAADYTLNNGLPVFLLELADGVFYGFPTLDERGVKFAEHSGGRIVEDPLTVDRSIDPEDQRRLTRVLSQFLPGVSPRLSDHTVCLYTMSPDENFIIDRHPRHSNVVFAAGLSGHGFKFAPVLGKALADLAVDSDTELPIAFLSLSRFGWN
jgi:monomeric sarcosine oxidase